MNTLTVNFKEIAEQYLFKAKSLNEAIEMVKTDNYKPYPTKPTKPFLPQNHSLAQLEEYSIAFQEYGKKKEDYDFCLTKYRENENYINSILEEMVKHQTAFYSVVPEKYQAKVWAKAWEDGHANGWSEVYFHLNELVNIFE